MSVTGFENYTYELNDFELNVLVPVVVWAWKTKPYEEKGFTKMKDMVKGLKKYYTEKGEEKTAKRITPPRLRKVFHHIRVQGLVPGLVATSKGYFKTKDVEVMKKYVESCRERSNSFAEVAQAMDNQLVNLLKERA